MTHYLIDYESIQPKQMGDWIDEASTVALFIGPQQHRLPFDLVETMQALGARGRYIRLERTGKNALDFHLAFYLGEGVGQEPEAEYRVLTKDSGFDALIAHLQQRGVRVERMDWEPTPD
ncbi:hypothetical protein F2Q65_17305 [Thiohalocapsa marina]|uniref:PIN-like domain-containing protein n=1 Tax=Thiohalocapsa marina TaxID=424902 RepID=A0A5M8FFN8_9GAMM|nr:PIN domain-containing protein [Thiohalocapsa marina]KAA6182730.1 hypothetical protein F2Q65_17305 [Thiohalocapsa marina]